MIILLSITSVREVIICLGLLLAKLLSVMDELFEVDFGQETMDDI